MPIVWHITPEDTDWLQWSCAGCFTVNTCITSISAAWEEAVIMRNIPKGVRVRGIPLVST